MAVRGVVMFCVFVLLLSVPDAALHLRSATLLLRLQGGKEASGLAKFGAHPIRTEEITFGDGYLARIYSPTDLEDPPGILMVHGVHRDGIDESRQVEFARTMAASGVMIMTPYFDDLAHYRLSPSMVDRIGSAAIAFAERMKRQRVGVSSISFGGGLSLMAAADPQWSKSIAFVVAVGAHHDLGRVARFFVGEDIEDPHGQKTSIEANPYGARVLVYQYLEDFFSLEDLDVARVMMETLLSERVEEARKLSKSLSPSGQAVFDGILRSPHELQLRFRVVLDRHAADFDAVSPRSRLGELEVPVFLLHGALDPVIPSGESLWIARDVPEAQLEQVLISPVIRHAEIDQTPALKDQWNLAHFMAEVLRHAQEMDGTRPTH